METPKIVQQDKPVQASVEKHKIELEIEELEPIVAPRLAGNHNENMVRDIE